MGFTTQILGLNGEHVTSGYGEPRVNCPHKGTDYSSSQVQKDFTCGVYGRVIPPTESGNWGTIAVQPFHAMEYTIQYIHCSAIYVGINQIVYPWTVLGKTGDVAPPGTDITGIHLHLQVFKSGVPQNACWGAGRNFADPETWPITNHLAGVWVGSRVEIQSGVTVEINSRLRIFGDTVGSQFIAEKRSYAERIGENTGRLMFMENRSYWDGQISARWQDGIQVNLPAGSCVARTAPPENKGCQALPQSLVIKMVSAMELGGENSKPIWTKSNPPLTVKTKYSGSALANASSMDFRDQESYAGLMRVVAQYDGSII